MKIAEAEKQIKEQLKMIYEEQEAINISELVIEDITSLSKAKRLIKKDEVLSPGQSDKLHQYIQRLQKNEPVQYVLQKTVFCGLEIFVNNDVLIPRPETEELVDWIVNDVASEGKDVFERRPGEADETTELKILDVGTGSGCIALALKKILPKAEVWACDISEGALNVARRNGSQLDIRIDFLGLDFLNPAEQKQLPTVDIVVCNPPYVPMSDKEKMNANVVDHEPHAALFVPDDDALVFYKILAEFGEKRIYPNGRIYMEIHEDLGKEVMEIFQKHGYRNVTLKKDMQGKDRMVRAGRT